MKLTTSKKDKQEDITQAYKIFSEFDKDNSGTISVEEWGNVMNKFGHEASTQEIKELIKRQSAKGREEITFEEFHKFINTKKKEVMGEEHEQMARAFQLFDKDQDGVVSPLELKLGLEKWGQEMSLEELEILVSSADKDGDGQVNFTEFCKIMKLR